MSANKKPRKKYVPRRIIPDTLSYVIAGVKPMTTSQRVRLGIAHHGSMTRMVQGKADKDDWDDICGMLNVAVALCGMGIGKEFETEIRQAMISHAECGRRLHKHGKFGYSGLELQQVNTALEIHEAQLDVATIIQLEQAQDIVLEANRKRNFYVSVHREGKYGDGKDQADVPDVGAKEP